MSDNINGSIVYCRFSDKNFHYNLNTKLYAYYIDSTPKQIWQDMGLSIGTIFMPVNEFGSRMYENTELRCEIITGVKDKADANFLEGRDLKEFKKLYIIKQSNIDNNCCRFDKRLNIYVYKDLYYNIDEFWQDIVKYGCDKEKTDIEPLYALMSNKGDIDPLMMLALSGQNLFSSKENKEPMSFTFSLTDAADSLKFDSFKFNKDTINKKNNE